jgi:hypothetical protein
MKTCWILVISPLLLALGSCGPTQTVAEKSPAPAPANTIVVSSTTPDATTAAAAGMPTTTATPTVIETGAWQAYHNTHAGFDANYPSDWTVNESSGMNSELITRFMAPGNGQGIVVSILNGAPAEAIPDMPNTRCHDVKVSGLSGRYCFDTIAFNFVTTLINQGKQYIIASSGKHPDQNVYQRFLESFSLTP